MSEAQPLEVREIAPASIDRAVRAAAGARRMLVALREPAYLKLLGKAAGIGWGAGIARRLLPGPLADVALLLGGVALGLEMAAYVGDANDIYRDSIEARVTEAPALRGWVSSSADSRDELVEELENDAPPTPGG